MNVSEIIYYILVLMGRFHQHFTSSFYTCRSQNRKKDCQVKQLYCAFGICASKSCSLNVGEIDPRSASLSSGWECNNEVIWKITWIDFVFYLCQDSSGRTWLPLTELDNAANRKTEDGKL